MKLFITRRWKFDLRAAITLQLELQRAGVACELVMPSNFKLLERGLAACRMVISENLHGLVLAARNLVPVIAVNDYRVGSPNFKKFNAFLAQSSSEDLFFNSQTPAEKIAETLAGLRSGSEVKQQDFRALRERVGQQYAAALGGLVIPV